MSENIVGTSSTPVPTVVPQDSSDFENLASMNLELSDFNERIRLLRRIRSRGREDYLIGNQDILLSIDCICNDGLLCMWMVEKGGKGS